MRAGKNEANNIVQIYTTYAFYIACCGYHCELELVNNQQGNGNICEMCLIK